MRRMIIKLKKRKHVVKQSEKLTVEVQPRRISTDR